MCTLRRVQVYQKYYIIIYLFIYLFNYLIIYLPFLLLHGIIEFLNEGNIRNTSLMMLTLNPKKNKK